MPKGSRLFLASLFVFLHISISLLTVLQCFTSVMFTGGPLFNGSYFVICVQVYKGCPECYFSGFEALVRSGGVLKVNYSGKFTLFNYLIANFYHFSFSKKWKDVLLLTLTSCRLEKKWVWSLMRNKDNNQSSGIFLFIETKTTTKCAIITSNKLQP